jgi:hypothetical protein
MSSVWTISEFGVSAAIRVASIDLPLELRSSIARMNGRS